MSESIKLFLCGIANSINPDGYHNVVTRPKRLGEISSRIKTKRVKVYKKANKEINGRIAKTNS